MKNIHPVRTHFKERSADDFLKGVFNDDFVRCFLILFMKAYDVDTHLNCLDKSRQFK